MKEIILTIFIILVIIWMLKTNNRIENLEYRLDSYCADFDAFENKLRKGKK